ncbi:unnamed protein product [Rotaria sp. Silwood2]|nr:unnamed protein product [Rotaria sp. Silwood2]
MRTKHMSSVLLLTTTGLEYFGQQFFSTVYQSNNNQNVFLSPGSIARAISMCTVGARQETLDQMLLVLDASSKENLIQTAEQIMHVFSLAKINV